MHHVRAVISKLQHPTSARSGSPKTQNSQSSPRHRHSQKGQQQQVRRVHWISDRLQSPQNMQRTGHGETPAEVQWR